MKAVKCLDQCLKVSKELCYKIPSAYYWLLVFFYFVPALLVV
jgi:hypothetical protein